MSNEANIFYVSEQVKLIPWDELTSSFTQHLAEGADALVGAATR